jgi:hypothetical protein
MTSSIRYIGIERKSIDWTLCPCSMHPSSLAVWWYIISVRRFDHNIAVFKHAHCYMSLRRSFVSTWRRHTRTAIMASISRKTSAACSRIIQVYSRRSDFNYSWNNLDVCVFSVALCCMMQASAANLMWTFRVWKSWMTACRFHRRVLRSKINCNPIKNEELCGR